MGAFEKFADMAKEITKDTAKTTLVVGGLAVAGSMIVSAYNSGDLKKEYETSMELSENAFNNIPEYRSSNLPLWPITGDEHEHIEKLEKDYIDKSLLDAVQKGDYEKVVLALKREPSVSAKEEAFSVSIINGHENITNLIYDYTMKGDSTSRSEDLDLELMASKSIHLKA